MHTDWRNFLQRQGAVFDADRVLHFGDAQTELRNTSQQAVIADLSGNQGLIAVEGADARNFLQGQLSTDLLVLTPAISQFSSWSNAKGRVVATLRVVQRGEQILLAVPQALATQVRKGLSMYILRARARLTDAGDTLCQFGLAGGQATDLLAGCDLDVPTEINGITENRGVQLLRLHGNTPRYSVLGEASSLPSLWTKLLDHGAQPAGCDPWALLRILAGEPEVHPQTSGHFVAQMLGLEELGAVHFNKGCYLGQEVIARAHYRGAVKRHLHRASCDSAILLQPGMDILTGDDKQPVGEIVDACRDANDKWQMLFVLKDESDAALLHIHGSAVNLLS